MNCEFCERKVIQDRMPGYYMMVGEEVVLIWHAECFEISETEEIIHESF